MSKRRRNKQRQWQHTGRQYAWATMEQANKYLKEGEDFIYSNPAHMFVDGAHGFQNAIAEYLANKDGLTLFESGANVFSFVDEYDTILETNTEDDDNE
tara:strand:+ start:434 stop:727 length:294 start_codon:yes stop_codon:yes gene_type:complete